MNAFMVRGKSSPLVATVVRVPMHRRIAHGRGVSTDATGIRNSRRGHHAAGERWQG